MAKAVFQHRPDSIYEDVLSEVYDFPRQYLAVVRAAIGDWVVFYRPRKSGGDGVPMTYFATARLSHVVPHPSEAGRYHALIDPLSFLPLPMPVPAVHDGRVMERVREAAPGVLARGGIVQRAVRALPDADFEAILTAGLGSCLGPERPEATTGFADAPEPFARPVAELLLSRPVRDRAFRRLVLEAYDGTCAVSGLSLRNGGGWMEVEAAHIRAVEAGGPDIVPNGIALSATLHKLFDRGLFSIGDDHAILVSENRIPRADQDRLFRPERRLALPQDPRLRPHPAFLAWHRQTRFGGGDGSGLWSG